MTSRWIIFPKPAPHPEPKPDPSAEVLKQILARLERIERLQHLILHKGAKLMGVVEDLNAKVDQLGSAVQSLSDLCDAQFTALQNAANSLDAAAIQADIDKLEAQRAEIAATLTRDAPPAPPVP